MKKLFYLIALAGLMTSCMKESNNGNTAANEAKTQRFYDEVMNAHNPAMVDSFCTADFIDHQADPHYPKGVAGLKAAFVDFFGAYPDLHVKTNWMISKGDTIVVHYSMNATNSGPLMGMPASNKKVNVDGVDVLVIKDGKACEHWGYYEEGKMMTQLGMMGNMNGQANASDQKMEEKK